MNISSKPFCFVTDQFNWILRKSLAGSWIEKKSDILVEKIYSFFCETKHQHFVLCGLNDLLIHEHEAHILIRTGRTFLGYIIANGLDCVIQLANSIRQWPFILRQSPFYIRLWLSLCEVNDFFFNRKKIISLKGVKSK